MHGPSEVSRCPPKNSCPQQGEVGCLCPQQGELACTQGSQKQPPKAGQNHLLWSVTTGALASPTPSGHLYSLGNLQPSMFFIYFPSCGVVYKGQNRRMGTPAPQELMPPPSTPTEQEVPATSTQAEAPVVPTQPDVHAASRPAAPTTVPPPPLPPPPSRPLVHLKSPSSC